MASTLLRIFPTPDDLLALEPEDLAAVLIEVIPGLLQNEGFQLGALTAQVHSQTGQAGYYPPDPARRWELALVEALSWLETQGLIVRIPGDPRTYFLTRRGRKLRTRADVNTYRLGRTLPIELLQPELADKVHHLYLRGDYDTAVFQAFKMVEIALRRATGAPAEMTAQKVARAAFQPETGKLTDQELPSSERQAMSDLFAGALGYAKNPRSHRDVTVSRQDAARLIVFASHLLDLVTWREIMS